MNSYLLRSSTIAILVIFVTASLLSFSLFVELRPAQAFFFFTFDAAQFALLVKEFVKDFLKAVVIATILNIAATLAAQIFDKLESVHTIHNFLGYSDALGFDIYIGSKLNSLLNPNKSNSDVPNDPSEQNLASIVTQSNALPINSSPLFSDPNKVAALAGLNLPAKVTNATFNAEPTEIDKNSSARIIWNVSGDNIYLTLQGKEFGASNMVSVNDLVGSRNVRPTQTTKYYLNIHNKSNALVIKQLAVEIKVRTTAADNFASGINPGSGQVNLGGGLSPEDEVKFLRGGIAMLTSAVSCGGVNNQAIENLAIYQATKARGFLMEDLSPRSGTDYYTKLSRLGNPYASPSYQYLVLQDVANSVESQSRAAVNQELVSSGNKVARSSSNTILRANATINSEIDKSLASMFEKQGISTGAGLAANVVASAISNMIVNVIFKSKDARLIADKNSCGVPRRVTSSDIAPNYETAPPPDVDTSPCDPVILGDCGESPGVTVPVITVNEEDSVTIDLGENVALHWEPGSIEGDVEVKNLPESCTTGRAGDCTFAPTEDTLYTLKIADQTYGVASVTIRTPDNGVCVGDNCVEPPPGGPTCGPSQAFDLKPTSVLSGESVEFCWDVTSQLVGSPNAVITVTKEQTAGGSGSSNIDVGPTTATGKKSVVISGNPGDKFKFTFDLRDSGATSPIFADNKTVTISGTPVPATCNLASNQVLDVNPTQVNSGATIRICWDVRNNPQMVEFLNSNPSATIFVGYHDVDEFGEDSSVNFNFPLNSRTGNQLFQPTWAGPGTKEMHFVLEITTKDNTGNDIIRISAPFVKVIVSPTRCTTNCGPPAPGSCGLIVCDPVSHMIDVFAEGTGFMSGVNMPLQAASIENHCTATQPSQDIPSKRPTVPATIGPFTVSQNVSTCRQQDQALFVTLHSPRLSDFQSFGQKTAGLVDPTVPRLNIPITESGLGSQTEWIIFNCTVSAAAPFGGTVCTRGTIGTASVKLVAAGVKPRE